MNKNYRGQVEESGHQQKLSRLEKGGMRVSVVVVKSASSSFQFMTKIIADSCGEW